VKGKFDAVVSVGVIFHNHVSNAGLDDLNNLVKVGGYISFNYREDHDEKENYTEKAKQMEEEGLWK